MSDIANQLPVAKTVHRGALRVASLVHVRSVRSAFVPQAVHGLGAEYIQACNAGCSRLSWRIK
eukprot:1619872-Amphidinium_carterae.3